jgi:hypothetical protein
LLLGSSNDSHPHGLANGSDQVGRNYIRHNNTAVIALSRTPNPTRLQKTLVLNDWYLKGEDWDYPWGSIQMLGKSDGEQLQAMAPHFLAWGAKLTRGLSSRTSLATVSTSGCRRRTCRGQTAASPSTRTAPSGSPCPRTTTPRG